MKWKYFDYVLAGFAALGFGAFVTGCGYLACWAYLAVWAR